MLLVQCRYSVFRLCIAFNGCQYVCLLFLLMLHLSIYNPAPLYSLPCLTFHSLVSQWSHLMHLCINLRSSLIYYPDYMKHFFLWSVKSIDLRTITNSIQALIPGHPTVCNIPFSGPFPHMVISFPVIFPSQNAECILIYYAASCWSDQLWHWPTRQNEASRKRGSLSWQCHVHT